MKTIGQFDIREMLFVELDPCFLGDDCIIHRLV